ncbi:uncharacterized protein ASPGLDRAFT_800090 [Aspergillus glaucus CBS 516.65]|uniref:DUF7924 domain-containing protein n=1 Tax=Aspergillus glaucus CBS 516.65 TaxID=1160497 RepID=A0A1L9VAE4_ASPGL|nr:hypothetical protein ASPGLDRAFT_800090 [Aspergillus glaucus CBS 516.65]OJJ80901.1 hypothetical protein ASPGLDRAFT_800090 [Aspergillus glaucus CBS 516.65]
MRKWPRLYGKAGTRAAWWSELCLNIVRFRKLLRNKEVGAIANAQWADIPLAAPWGWMPRQIPAPCPDITVGLNTSTVNYAAEIRSLEPYACPVIKDSFILFPVFTLKVRGIPHGMFYPRSQNLYNGAVMLRNLRELHSTARGEESCVKDFDHKVFVLTTSISVDTVEINIHFTEVEGGVLTFKSAMMDIWLTQSSEDMPKMITNVRNAIDKAISSNQECIMQDLQCISERLALQPPSSPSCFGKRARADSEDEVETERDGCGKKLRSDAGWKKT